MDADKIVALVLVALPDATVPIEAEITDAVDRLTAAFGADDATKAQVLKTVLARRLVRMDTGFALVENHKPWVNARRPSIDPYYWSRFRIQLQRQGFGPNVVSALDRSTDNILDLLGNPEERDTWKRRGLVMGDVQSGKTATYSALICKAADAGYRFVVLLTGTIENLRQQTQERLDSSFVGFDSSERLKRDRKDLKVGVGTIDARRQATVFTSTAADFRASTLDALGLSLNALKEPALVVIKKHTRILDNLRNWIESYTAAAQGDAIDLPMLVIDDEADNASINTNDPGADPTAVNKGIRALLKLFRRTTYVGFTATPFANIFVNPDTTEEMLGDDLFPRDFIYTLDAPTNYFGPRRVFVEETGEKRHLRCIEDVEDSIPSSHRSTFIVTALPDSLVEALRVFLVANAIRDLRGEGPTHRSMLVNLSHFTNVQDQVEGLLRQELDRLRTDIRMFSATDPEEALGNHSIRSLRAAWEKEYAGCEFKWAEVQRALHDAALPVTTIAVNQRSGPRALNYRAHRDTGLRVVAVGGNSLSRGLTLEGLVVSYFRRTTQMYDTLLQMGRWFGYRPGYEDLCRVWLPQEAMDWYGHIAEASEELRAELRKMFRLGRTPKEFGLAVRSHPDSLLVTARNKMRTAEDLVRVISVSEQSFESVELPAASWELKANWEGVERFVHDISKYRMELTGVTFYRGVPRQDVARVLRGFRVPATEFRFQPSAIADLLTSLADGSLAEWDVAIPSGDGERIALGAATTTAQERKVRVQDGVIVVSGTKRRVGSRGVEKVGLADEQRRRAEEAARSEAEAKARSDGQPPPAHVNVADRHYRAERTRPLLLLHVLAPRQDDDSDSLPNEGRPVVALGLSFPRIDGAPTLKEVRYKANIVMARERFAEGVEPGDDDFAEVES
jgi:hypothetical protein